MENARNEGQARRTDRRCSERGERMGCNPGEIQIQGACLLLLLPGWMDGVKYRENDLNPAQYRQHQLSNRMKRCFPFREPWVQNRKWKIEQLNHSSLHQSFHIVMVYNSLHRLPESVALYLQFSVGLLPHRKHLTGYDISYWDLQLVHVKYLTLNHGRPVSYLHLCPLVICFKLFSID